MPQREFPWMQMLAPPRNAPREAVSRCLSHGMAVRASLEAKPGGPWSDSWLAARLGISRGYMSRLLNDKQEMPTWMLEPLAWATGSRLVMQYDELQRAIRAMERGMCLVTQIAHHITAEAA